MTSHPPPVPPEQQSPFSHTNKAEVETGEKAKRQPGEDPSGRGRQQNLTENMANKGYQQDR
jgi:hypothetical protein